jgi:hypothetical protein
MIAAGLVIAMLLAVAAFAQSASFRFFGPLSRIITPNGDSTKVNGTAIFCFDNPADSGISGNIFTLLGSAVATLGPNRQILLAQAAPSESTIRAVRWVSRADI